MVYQTLLEGILEAVRLIVTGDPEVFEVAFRSLHVSVLGVSLATSWSIPIAILLGFKKFPGKRLLKALFNSLIGVPTVTLGLLLYLMFSRSGPLGIFQLLYTTTGIAIGQAVLITPIVVTFASSAIEGTERSISDLARTLGASEFQVSLTVARESFWGIALSVVAAFNRAFAELGVAMMIGGNIRYVTRVLTTAIALETARGEIAFSIALGIILLSVVFLISALINLARRNQ